MHLRGTSRAPTAASSNATSSRPAAGRSPPATDAHRDRAAHARAPLRHDQDPRDLLAGLQALRAIARPRRPRRALAAGAVARRGLDRRQLHRHLHPRPVGPARRPRRDDDLVARPSVPLALPEGQAPVPISPDEVDGSICAGATASYMLQAVRIVDHFMGPGERLALRQDDADRRQPHQPDPLSASPDREQARADSVVERAQDWLQKNMTHDVTHVRSSRARWRSATARWDAGLPLPSDRRPLGYLQSVRLQAARALLEAGDMPVQSIAIQVGYRDVSSFSRLFRKAVGISPGSYRRRFHQPGSA